jgi:putative phosphonate metabolism protein
MAPRYAVYYAPAVDSPWWRFGAGWLGWDDARGQALAQPRLPEFSAEDFHALTGEPRRYGFHATLKAPFRLHPAVNEATLRDRLAMLAPRLRAVAIGPLVPVHMEGFVALAPRERQPAIDALATRCVLDLDDLRAPLTPEEVARREAAGLDARQRELLARYGYPHVLAYFRLHLTLSGTVDPVTADLLMHRAGEQVDPLNARHPLRLDRLCLFREDHPGAPFLRMHEQALAS